MDKFDSDEESEADRRHNVEMAFAAVERQGRVISPVVRLLGERYIAGELTFSQVQNQLNGHAAETIAQAQAAFGWIGRSKD